MIINSKICLCIVTCVAICMTFVSASEDTVDKIVAKADYGVITYSELMEASAPTIQQIRQSLPPEEWDQRIEEVRRHILMQMINEYVCVRFARENEIQITE